MVYVNNPQHKGKACGPYLGHLAKGRENSQCRGCERPGAEWSIVDLIWQYLRWACHMSGYFAGDELYSAIPHAGYMSVDSCISLGIFCSRFQITTAQVHELAAFRGFPAYRLAALVSLGTYVALQGLLALYQGPASIRPVWELAHTDHAGGRHWSPAAENLPKHRPHTVAARRRLLAVIIARAPCGQRQAESACPRPAFPTLSVTQSKDWQLIPSQLLARAHLLPFLRFHTPASSFGILLTQLQLIAKKQYVGCTTRPSQPLVRQPTSISSL
jgi:hypothetical protein